MDDPLTTATLFAVRRLGRGDDAPFAEMLDLFARVFEDPETYSGKRPGPVYRDRLLDREEFVALVALRDDAVIGALVAYELPKFEQERSELYVYDLAVDERARRRGVATALIEEVRAIACARGASVVMIQADREDAPAVALYTKLGTPEEVLHFDIDVEDEDRGGAA